MVVVREGSVSEYWPVQCRSGGRVGSERGVEDKVLASLRLRVFEDKRASSQPQTRVAVTRVTSLHGPLSAHTPTLLTSIPLTLMLSSYTHILAYIHIILFHAHALYSRSFLIFTSSPTHTHLCFSHSCLTLIRT